MKIAVFHDLPHGGGKRLAHDLCRGLSEKGHSIDLHVFEHSDDGLFAMEPVSNAAFKYKLFFAASARYFRPYLAWRSVELARNMLLLMLLKYHHRKIARTINREGYDVAFIHSCKHTQAPCVLRYLHLPTVYFANEPLRIIYDNDIRPQTSRAVENTLARFSAYWGDWASFIEKLVLKKVDKRNISSASYILTSSKYTQQRLSDCYGVHATLCYPGVDTDRFKPFPVDRIKQVLSIGSIFPHKNHEFVINSIGLVERDVRPDLVIISTSVSHKHLERLRKLAREKGVDLEVRMMIPEDELVRAYNQTTVVVYTPLQEPFGLVALEAMACCTPVIGVNEGGIAETIVDGKTGILIRRDESECARAIKRLMSDTAMREKLGKSSRTYVECEWSSKQSIDRLEGHLQRAAGSRRPKQ